MRDKLYYYSLSIWEECISKQDTKSGFLCNDCP